jgi:heptosyltransferase-2
MNNERSRILIIRFSSLGDLVIMTALVDAMAEAFPHHDLHLATKEQYRGLFEGSTRLSRIHTLPSGSGFGGLLRLRRELAGEDFEIIVDAHNVIRSNFLYRTLGAGKKVQLEKDQLAKLALIRGEGTDATGAVTSMKDCYLGLVEQLGASGADTMPRLEPPPGSMEAAAGFLSEHDIDEGGFAVIAPGARWETKRWPEEHYTELVRLLSDAGVPVVITGDEHEKELCGRICRETGAADACGAFSIMETAAILGKAGVLVTNDSAPLHIAEACGTPVVGIYGPTVRQFGYFPLLERSVAMEVPLDCRPCSRNGSKECRLESRECLERITPGDVLEKTLSILGIGGGF